jgi:Protein of unknown function (DUF4019)
LADYSVNSEDLNDPPTAVGGIHMEREFLVCRKDLKNPPTTVGGISDLLRGRRYLFIFPILLSLLMLACGREANRGRVPSEVQEVIANVGDDIAYERYEKIYNEASELWRRDVTLDQSTEVFKTLRTKLGKVTSRSLHSANEQQNSGGPLKGHVFILSYETNFERGDGMENFTLIEENGRWLLARYFVNSTALK